jgi:hydrogenase maturation protease
MSECVRGCTLIIGIGNPLRRDDGLGWAIAERLSQACNTTWDIRMVHQLTPDVAQWMANASLVIMVDASHEGEPGALHVRVLSPSAQPSAIGTHHTTPAELAALTTIIYGHCPPGVIVSMTGADFSIGEGFSSLVAQGLPLVEAAVREKCGGAAPSGRADGLVPLRSTAPLPLRVRGVNPENWRKNLQ